MKNIEDLLQELSRQDISSERKETTLTESEIKRLHEKTLQKINGEIHTKTNVENRKSKKQNNITTHPSFWRRYSRPFAAAAAACLVCMVGVTAFAAFSFDDSIRNFFNIYDNQSIQISYLPHNPDQLITCVYTHYCTRKRANFQEVGRILSC